MKEKTNRLMPVHIHNKLRFTCTANSLLYTSKENGTNRFLSVFCCSPHLVTCWDSKQPAAHFYGNRGKGSKFSA